MKELIGTYFEMVAALHGTPKPLVIEGRDAVGFVLATQFNRTLSNGETVNEVCFTHCLAEGRLGSRMLALRAGTGLVVSGDLVYLNGWFVPRLADAAVLPDVPDRLLTDVNGGFRLQSGDFYVRLRGTLVVPPQQLQLLNGTPVTNARLGLTIKAGQDGDRYAFLELAAYGELGTQLNDLTKGNMVSLRAILQKRPDAEGHTSFQRAELTALERLHPERAMV